MWQLRVFLINAEAYTVKLEDETMKSLMKMVFWCFKVKRVSISMKAIQDVLLQ